MDFSTSTDPLAALCFEVNVYRQAIPGLKDPVKTSFRSQLEVLSSSPSSLCAPSPRSVILLVLYSSFPRFRPPPRPRRSFHVIVLILSPSFSFCHRSRTCLNPRLFPFPPSSSSSFCPCHHTYPRLHPHFYSVPVLLILSSPMFCPPLPLPRCPPSSSFPCLPPPPSRRSQSRPCLHPSVLVPLLVLVPVFLLVVFDLVLVLLLLLPVLLLVILDLVLVFVFLLVVLDIVLSSSFCPPPPPSRPRPPPFSSTSSSSIPSSSSHPPSRPRPPTFFLDLFLLHPLLLVPILLLVLVLLLLSLTSSSSIPSSSSPSSALSSNLCLSFPPLPHPRFRFLSRPLPTLVSNK